MSTSELTDRDAVHHRVCALKGQRGGLDYEQGRWLLAAHRLGLHEALGLGSFAEYAERYGGIDARQARERVRVAEALEELPDLAAALKSGELGWSAVRELTRVVVEATEKGVAGRGARADRARGRAHGGEADEGATGPSIGPRPSPRAA
ncbi:MAG: DUF222 domain-containing protein [Sandaracinaceae bacterium]|nr:DUF222 domain-containing protein [Sandaracinaceae bacterium]